MPKVYLFHGRLSSPQSVKMQRLKQIAISHGMQVELPDHSQISDPEARVAAMRTRHYEADKTIFVGSSMGAYVATMLSEQVRPQGLFLLAPAFYMPRYAVQQPIAHADKIAIIHGWYDETVPVEHSIRYAQTFAIDLHVVNSTHNLHSALDQVADLFTQFIA